MSDDGTRTVLSNEETFGLGELVVRHPPGTTALSAASRIALEAVGTHPELFKGTGIDWGSGTGALAIAAARVPTVESVIGLEVNSANVAAAEENAQTNGVAGRVRFLHSDSFTPFAESDRQMLGKLRGQIQFLLANPPSSEGDDGFEFHRVVLRGARDFLAPGAVVCLNVSYQYGPERIDQLTETMPDYRPCGVLASSPWMRFDLPRTELLNRLRQYAQAERDGGWKYTFPNPDDPEGEHLTAVQALERYEKFAESPWTMWLVLLFRFQPVTPGEKRI